MFYIYAPYVTPSGKRLSYSKIIIYEAVPSNTRNLYTTTRKFELTNKGWKTAKYSGSTFCQAFNALSEVPTINLTRPRTLKFDDFNTAYAAKCLLINRIPEIYLNMITALTSKMNSIKSVKLDPRHMSDAIPELFI